MDFSAVILAGGQSSRMGRDKAWLKVDGQTLLARQIELVRQIEPDEIFISGRPQTIYAEFNLPVLQDRFADAGPLAGVHRALEECRSSLLLVLAVDMPHMTADTLKELFAQPIRSKGTVPCFNGQMEPLAAIYPKAALPLAEEQLRAGSYAMRDFVLRCLEKDLVSSLELSPTRAGCFANWNAPGDVEKGNAAH